MAPTYLFEIGMIIIAIGFVISTLSITIHHFITKD